MTTRVAITGPRKTSLDVTGERKRKVGVDEAAASMGGARMTAAERLGSPSATFAMRAEMARRLRSTGGRPGLEGAERKTKVPLSAEQYAAIAGIAEKLAEDGIRPSFGQIASVLIDMGLRKLDPLELKRAVEEFRDRAAVAGE